MRKNAMPEIGNIIPDEEPVTNLWPPNEVVAEWFVSFTIQRFAERRFNRAKPDNNVVASLDIFRRLASVTVGQGAYSNIRKFFFDLGCDRVNKMQKRTGGAAFFGVNSLAARTPAVARRPVIILVILWNWNNFFLNIWFTSLFKTWTKIYKWEQEDNQMGTGQTNWNYQKNWGSWRYLYFRHTISSIQF